jgi:hypothetical protein
MLTRLKLAQEYVKSVEIGHFLNYEICASFSTASFRCQ